MVNRRSTPQWIVKFFFFPLSLTLLLSTVANAQVPESPTTSNSSSEASSAELSADEPETMFPHFKDTRFWLSGQANFIFQTHTDFSAAYTGTHSLKPDYEKATSRVLTLYTGDRLNNSTEFLADIEETGGSALSSGFGLAGNTNLDIVRNPLLSKAPYLGRGMFHKVFALSKDKVENERTPFSLFDELPRRRLEFRFGKFSMPDFLRSQLRRLRHPFPIRQLDHRQQRRLGLRRRHPRIHRRRVVDYEDRNWGLRFAETLMPKVANGIDLVWKPWQVHEENVEYELRRGVIPHKSGTVRVIAYTNAANMGIYREQVIKAAEEDTTPEITDHPWHITHKYGFGLNLEQNLTNSITAFARFGWENGKTESFVYTEVDQTFAEGVTANGALWKRKQDRAGVAFVSNAIKKDHQNYLAAGGLGFLLGDGHLTYGRENILESYYTVHAWRGIYLAPGVQHINNPGYNRDRGPVVVPSFRAHVEF